MQEQEQNSVQPESLPIQRLRSRKEKEGGFTLIEMIGVLAVIAVLASMVAPKIFDAIRDSKVDTLLADVGSVRTQIVSFYKDTSRFPQHYTGVGVTAAAAVTPNELITDAAGGVVGTGIRGWRGPYLDKELENPLNPNSNLLVESSRQSANANVVEFDINGDGVVDYTNQVAAAGAAGPSLKNDIAYIVIDGLTYDEAERISKALDGDADLAGAVAGATTGPWWQNGRVTAVTAPAGAGSLAAATAGPGALAAMVQPPRNVDVAIWIYLGSR